MAGFYVQPIDGGKLTPAAINISSTGTVITGTTGFIIRVYKIFLVVTGATNLKFVDGSTDLTGAMGLSAGGSITLGSDGLPWFTCSSGANFVINLSSGTQTSGCVYYTSTAFT